MELIKKISILGDSISKGVILDRISQKYKILRESAADLFGRENNVVVKNYAKFGCTSERALEMTSGVLAGDDKSEIVLLELGGNDCDYNWDNIAENPNASHIANVTLEKFRENIKHIVDSVRESGKRLAIMTLPPIDSDKYFDWVVRGDLTRHKNILQFLGDKNYIYRHQEMYANALEEIASENNIFKVPVRSGLLSIKNYSDYICDDGIHLNESGQEKMKSIFNETYTKYMKS